MALKFYYAPVAYKVGKTYTALPNQSSADFATCTRSSPATFINQDGLLEEAPNDMPRLDWSNGRYPRLLLEGSSENGLNYSNDFTQWDDVVLGSGVAPVVTSNFGVSPDGTQNADKVVFNLGTGGASSAGNRSFLNESYTEDGSSPYVSSVWIKSLNGNRTITVDNDGQTTSSFDITSEWKKIETPPSTASDSVTVRSMNIGLKSDNNSESDTLEVLLYEAQTEAGNVPTSNISTNGSPVSRSADTGYITGDVSSVIDGLEGVFEVKLKFTDYIEDSRSVSISDGTDDNKIEVRVDTSGQLVTSVRTGGVSNTHIQNTYSSLNINAVNTVKIKWKSGDLGIKLNGIEIANSSNAFSSSSNLFTTVRMDRGQGSFPFIGELEYIKVYDSVSDY